MLLASPLPLPNKRLYGVAYCPSSETTLYTVTNPILKTVVYSVVIANVTAADATLSLSIVGSGGSAGLSNRVLGGVTIPAHTTEVVKMEQELEQGDFLSAIASPASAITLSISGYES